LTGHWVTASLHTVAVLRVPDLLAAGPRSVGEIAEATRTAPDALRRLLRALVAHGVFAEREAGRFEQAALSQCLRDDVPESVRPFLVLNASRPHWDSWGRMLHAVRTGQTAFSQAHGTELFEYMRHDAEAAAVFDRAMTTSVERAAADV